MPTRSQKLATDIYAQVVALKEREATPFHKKYGSLAHKLPVLIRTAGLIQALEFAASRNDAAWNQLLNHLAQIVLATTAVNGQGFRDASRRAGIAEYIRLTRAALDALLWYKRFGESVLGVTLTDAATTDDQEGN